MSIFSLIPTHAEAEGALNLLCFVCSFWALLRLAAYEAEIDEVLHEDNELINCQVRKALREARKIVRALAFACAGIVLFSGSLIVFYAARAAGDLVYVAYMRSAGITLLANIFKGVIAAGFFWMTYQFLPIRGPIRWVVLVAALVVMFYVGVLVPRVFW